jgi:hypothetical protein
MLTKTDITVDTNLLAEAVANLPSDEFRLTINSPTGDFFYDPWTIKEEYNGTVWEKLLAGFDFAIGEARIIILKEGTCYQSHADIDDRYHLNIAGNDSYLIDLETEQMNLLIADGSWYLMNAGKKHTAANFGRGDRIQLVVRKLLTKVINNALVSIEIQATGDHVRHKFDAVLSPWLNNINKMRMISDFSVTDTGVKFKIYPAIIDVLKTVLPEGFVIV